MVSTMSFATIFAIAMLLVSTTAVSVFLSGKAAKNRRARFIAVGVAAVCSVMTLIVGGVELGGNLGRDTALRDNRADAQVQVTNLRS